MNRKTLIAYVKLPNYQNYWIEAGFEEEMQAIRAAIAGGQEDRIPALSERWLSFTPSGSPSQVREGIEAWQAAGVKAVTVVPSSARGNQMVALPELLDLYRGVAGAAVRPVLDTVARAGAGSPGWRWRWGTVAGGAAGRGKGRRATEGRGRRRFGVGRD